ncbi:MAG: ATP-binding cassette domain-containing protein [Actinobacteria bacterium]|nr:ATP-binding cassette domain-containing protein [Actinomycetota bacterium]
MTEATTMLELKNVSRTYGRGRTQVRAVDDVSLAVSPGEIVLIMGPSGSGKTTLLSMAGGLLQPTSGRVIIGNDDLGGLDADRLARLRLLKVGFIFQAFNLLSSLSAIENVALVMNLTGRSDASVEQESQSLLKRLGLQDRMSHRPADLSGGEKQRVAIARALANNPPMILADEPTGNLDSLAGREVMMLLFDLAREEDKAVVVVSHDPRIVDIADRVLWLEDGRLSEQHPHLEEKVRDPVCGMQMELKDVVYTTTYQGHVYHFDREKCRQDFLKDPERYSD